MKHIIKKKFKQESEKLIGMKRIGLFVLLCFGVLLSSGAIAQEKDTLFFTLNEAVEFAEDNNLKFKNSKLDIKASKEKVWETTANGLPQINGEFSYQHIPGELPTVQFGGTNPQMTEFYRYVFNQFEAMGADVPAELRNALTTPVEPEPVKLGVKNSATYSVTVSQLIFSGEYIVGLQASRTYLQISKINEEKQKLDLKSNVIKSYLSALILEKNKAILDSNIVNVKSLLEETKKLVEAGFAQRTDVDQLRLNYNTIRNSLNSLERQVDLSYMLFKIQLGMDLDKELVLKDNIDKLRTSILKEDESNVDEFDMEENVNYKLAQNQQEISELNLKRAQSKFLPQISGFYQYMDKTNKPEFDFTINHTLGINISVPIFSSFQRNSVVQQRKIELKKAKNDKQLLEENLRSQLAQAQLDYNNALEKTQTARQNVELSQRIFKNTSKKYKEGMASSLELTQTNNNFLQAQSEYFNALNELFNAKIELEKVLNEL